MEDRRKFFRFDSPVSLKYTSLKNKFEDRGNTRNISREGVAISTERDLNTEDMVKMEFDIPGDNFPIFAQGMVVWVKKGDAKNDVGIKLTSITRSDRGKILEYAYQQWLKVKNMGRKE